MLVVRDLNRRAPRLALLSALSLLLPLAGCGGGADSATLEPGRDAAATHSSAAAAVSLAVEDVSVMAGAPEARFTILLSRPAEGPVSVRYATADGSAVAGTDYAPAAGELGFAPGETAKHVAVALLGTPLEAERAFSLRLADARGASLGDAEAQASIVRLEPDAAFDANWGDTGVFSSAGSCAACHSANGEVMTHAGRDVSPPDMWKHSMMGQAFTDPYFQAAMAEEVHLFPDLAGRIEDTCLTCHAPMGRTHAHQTGTGLDEDGNYRLETAFRQMHAREGVSCTACHQIQDDGKLGTPDSFGGQYTIVGGQIYGPHANPLTGAMQNNTQYSPVYSAHMNDSAMCATCHTVFTPVIDVNTGKPSGQAFAEQTPYLEWRNSVYGPGRAQEASCQSCHMPVPEEGYATPIATRPNGSSNPNFPARTPFHRHSFAGGNAHTLELLKAYRAVLGIEATTTAAGFDAAIDRTRRQLAQQTAALSIGALRVDEDAHLLVPVTIVNRSGHKLPTSYPSRRMWVHLRVTDGEGRVVFESGRPDARGRISVDAEHLRAACLEAGKEAPVAGCHAPHRDLIETPEQVAVYESVLGDANGNISYVLLHAARYLKDNRIPPRGFDRAAIPSDGTTAIIGGAATDPDFNRVGGVEGSGSDTVHYRVDTGGARGPFRVEARLLFQAVRPTFIESLQADEERVQRYRHFVDAIPPSVEELARAGASL